MFNPSDGLLGKSETGGGCYCFLSWKARTDFPTSVRNLAIAYGTKFCMLRKDQKTDTLEPREGTKKGHQ